MFETEQLEEVGNVLCILDESGDSRFQWDPDDAAQVAKAEAKFREMKSQGYIGYSVTKKGDRGEVLNAFDAKAERIIMHKMMVGG